MESEVSVILKNLIGLHADLKILNWCLWVLLKLESIIFNCENIVNQRKVRPRMIQGRIQIIFPRQRNE